MTKNTKVNRTQLIEELATRLGTSKAQAEKFLNIFVDTIADQLKKGNEVNITGFGVFRVVSRKSRMGVNPKTRQPMKIQASTSVGWKVGKTLKEAIRASESKK
jgi:DNA-binding protein HU-beta